MSQTDTETEAVDVKPFPAIRRELPKRHPEHPETMEEIQHSIDMPTPTATVQLTQTLVVGAGQVFDGGNRRYNLSGGDQSEGQPPVFDVMDGGTVKTLPEGVAALFGCRAGQKTFETKNAGGGYGVFFHVVLEGLRGEA